MEAGCSLQPVFIVHQGRLGIQLFLSDRVLYHHVHISRMHIPQIRQLRNAGPVVFVRKVTDQSGNVVPQVAVKNRLCFDFYGVPAWDLNALDVTNDDIEMLKNIFVRLKAEYDKSPEAYDYKEPLGCEEYYYLYTDKPFALKLTKEEAAGKVDMYKQMNMPMSEAEQEAYFKLHDVEA